MKHTPTPEEITVSGSGAKAARQSKNPKKSRFHFKITDENYDFLYRLAEKERLSIAAVLNKLLRDFASYSPTK